MKETNSNLQEEFKEFISLSPQNPPAQLSDLVRNQVLSSLQPQMRTVLAKFFLIQAFAVALTLTVCPQFGINPLKIHGLMGIYMQYGPHFCMLACGVTVLALSFVISGLLLRFEEWKIIKRLEYWIIPGLAFTVLGIFSAAGELVMLELAGLWLLGAFLGGKAALELTVFAHVFLGHLQKQK